jgi:hypothetical protein
VRVLVAMLATALAASCITSDATAPDVDLTMQPHTTIRTDRFQIGHRYTLGHSLSEWGVVGDGSIRITSIEVLHTSGVEVIDVGGYDSSTRNTQIGLVAGWPPPDVSVAATGDALYTTDWTGIPVLLIGFEVRAETSGARGLRTTWEDAAGQVHVAITDVAVASCAAFHCTPEIKESGEILQDLGLLGPGEACSPAESHDTA